MNYMEESLRKHGEWQGKIEVVSRVPVKNKVKSLEPGLLDPDELYDLFSDPDEHDNRINDPGLQKQRQELREQIIAWFTAYVDPARDASHECNTGYGQLRRVGTKSEGKPVFSEEGPYRRSVQNAFDRFAKPDRQQP